jgi:hypothetical protein
LISIALTQINTHTRNDVRDFLLLPDGENHLLIARQGERVDAAHALNVTRHADLLLNTVVRGEGEMRDER